MSAWNKFATGFYQQQKKKNPHYKFSQALKDAAKMYKKRGGDVKVGGVDPIIDNLLPENENVKNVAQAKSDKLASQTESVVAAAPAADSTVDAPAADSVDGPTSTLDSTDPSRGGKKSKKSAKKGKKSVKKGGKKGKKSAKKSRR